MKRLAVVGIGRMGERHARNIAKGVIKGGKLIAVCDTDSEKLKAFADKYKVPTYSCVEDMLSKDQ